MKNDIDPGAVIILYFLFHFLLLLLIMRKHNFHMKQIAIQKDLKRSLHQLRQALRDRKPQTAALCRTRTVSTHETFRKLFQMCIRDRTYSSTELYENIWGEIPVDTKNIVAVHIRHIREKIEIDPKNPRYVKVVWGRGYKIQSQTEN